ncbi:MAG TPA: tetratricopeptide repeat protein, partial [Chthoniobacterales bacterium]
NERTNIAGAGINVAQRVMDCGDAGHILLSKRAADDLAQYRQWERCLHELGECEVKHGFKLPLVSLYGDGFGNPELPQKLGVTRTAARTRVRNWRWLIGAGAGAAIIALAALVAFKGQLGANGGAGRLFGLRPRSAPEIPQKSIAVLPFESLSSDPENAFFADGVQDEILTHLAKIADLKVISRTSVMHYKGGSRRDVARIAQQLGVAHLLEGSVQRAGQKVRVIAQLIEPRGNAHLWAQTYDRDLADVFTIQTEIAQAIAAQLQAKLSPKEEAALQERPTTDVAAFDLYTRARTLLVTGLTTAQERRFREAVDLLERAVARDPEFYAAFGQLVFVHGSLYSGYDHTPARLASAEAALRRATQLRPDAAETHLARGWHLYYVARDYAGALTELQIASRGLPNDPRIPETTGYILRRQGKHEEGLATLEEAIRRDPRNVFTLAQIALSYQLLRRYPEAAAVLDRILEITPDDLAVATTRAGLDLLWRANTQPLHDLVARLRSEGSPNLSEAASDWAICALAERDWVSAEQGLAALGDNPFLVDWSIRLTRQFGEGLLARARGDHAAGQRAFSAARVEQEQIVRQQTDYAPGVCVLGLIDAALGNKEAALAAARRALELLPVEKHVTDGQRLTAYCAMIAAWAGEKDLALQYLTVAAPAPGGSTIASYGMLKLMPFWDPLRGDPRFDEIVASLAPKD